MVSFTRFALQLHVNKLAKACSKDTELQMRAHFCDIFEEAVDQDFLVKDPARKVKVPPHLSEKDKTTLSWGQLRSALQILEPDSPGTRHAPGDLARAKRIP